MELFEVWVEDIVNSANAYIQLSYSLPSVF